MPSQSHRQSWLAAQLAAAVHIVWTDNRTVMISVQGSPYQGYRLRLHHMFRQASDTVWQALAAYLRGTDADARGLLQNHIERHRHLIRRPPARQRQPWTLRSRGEYFDLEAIYGRLNRIYFANRIQARITWARRPPKRRRRSIRFGSYDAQSRLIRIHPHLDQSFVPRYVIESVVFHEMLHQLIPRQRLHGRWSVHPPEFRRQEQRYALHRHAKQWQRRHLSRLLEA